MPPAGSALELRHELDERLADARTRTDEIFRILKPEALYDRPIAERHRLIFYLGHVEVFDWNLIGRGACERPSFNEAYDKLFAFGIDPVDGGLPADQPSDWPTVAEIHGYNARLRGEIDRIVREEDWSTRPLLADGLAFHVAIEHRLMHAETLAYLLHQLPLARKHPVSGRPQPAAPSVTTRAIPIPAGRATLGLSRSAGVFGWDNEFEARDVDVPAFAIDSHPVTNGQFLDFLTAGGYRERSLWNDSDWAWREIHNVEHPVFWRRQGEAWLLRTMFDDLSLPYAWPAYVSHAEASAFARWRGLSLPTEAQFHRAAYGTLEGRERAYPWGDAAPAPRFGNFDFARWDPTAVGSHPDGDSAFGVSDLVGNGWEWTSSKFEPLPGFQAFPFYAGYSANFFDGKHYLMKGGSARTAACMLRRSFRNWFQPHYPFVYAKFRCVET
jgi:ergothioneine biosynthesis protein EgtB